ncbi:hypothetical protein MTX78_03980 [Hymenobacter tibetensis]|uniref:Lipoprotein n=1 Tax=Hymenobacter tibetensis TaxID=497967 RepID=A0ABY4D6Y5_9BACT|nr:hypothetical protein [Hymenobacter tibetensis]UOG75758.1 hypothetical protein MTX78_03980 [Hymenobacter tibetensis]
MKKLLKIPFLLALLVAGTLLTGCAASTQAVVSTGPVGYYGDYYGPRYRPYYGPRYYRPSRVIVRPAPVIVRPRPVIVHPGPRYYHRPYGGYRGGGRR